MKRKKFEAYNASNTTETQIRMGSYLEYVMNPTGTPHCPFIRKIVDGGKFYFAESMTVVKNRQVLEKLIEELVAEHERVADPMAIIAYVLLHPAMESPAMAVLLAGLRSQIRTSIIRRGYTIAFTHPDNQTGSHSASVYAQKYSLDEPLWVSQVPILMVRKLHKMDKPFMRTKETQEAFIHVFPEISFNTIENFRGTDDSIYVYQIEKHFKGEKINRIVQLTSEMIQVNHEYGFSVFLFDPSGELRWDYTIPIGFLLW